MKTKYTTHDMKVLCVIDICWVVFLLFLESLTGVTVRFRNMCFFIFIASGKKNFSPVLLSLLFGIDAVGLRSCSAFLSLSKKMSSTKCNFLCLNFPKMVCASKEIDRQGIAVICIFAILNVCWGMMASLPVSFRITVDAVFLSWWSYILNVMTTVFKAPLFPMQASEKGASGSQISPGEKKRVVQALILQRCT